MGATQKDEIRGNKLFQNVNFDTLSFQKASGKPCYLNHGELLYRSGEINTSLYLVVHGEINLIPSQFSSAAGSVVFSENDFFGVNEFFSKTPRRESAIALRDSHLIEFTKENIDELIKQSKTIMVNIKNSLGLTELDLPEEFSDIDMPSIEETIPINLEISHDPDSTEKPIQIEEQLVDEEISIEEELMSDGISIEEELLSEEISIEEKFLSEEISVEEEKKDDKNSIPPEIKSKIEEDFLQKIINEERLANNKNQTSEEVPLVEEQEGIDANLEDEKEIKTEKTFKDEIMDFDEPPEPSSTEMTFEQLEKINRAAQLVNSNVKIEEVLKNIVDVSVTLCSADRGTLYLVDRSKNELWSKVLQGGEPTRITLKMGSGFAGWSAENKEVINVDDASSDDRFNDSFDKASGYSTKSVLCFPIKNRNDDVLGVIQLLNSNKGTFSTLDENFISALSTHAAMALQNADLVEQLLKTERISSLGKMANFLIEDIRKPILVSKKYTEHLKRKELTIDVQNVIEMLYDQLNSIADFVEATSNYSQGKSVLKSDDVEINEKLSEFIERVDPLIQSSNCKIVVKFDMNVKVNIDSKEFFQGFKHIIKNACDAMPDGGEINISTLVEGENLKIRIKDNGLGIPSGFDEKIFEPFMSFGKKTGTGLGLSVTRKIIEEHGGTVIATSNSGTGSTFIISLPIVK